ncbi:MAG TPA: hypothetical protein VMV94_11480 [Phycisphaerae bacterium]|nr:hypothetical protein [Phycisphaerae bacterium]
MALFAMTMMLLGVFLSMISGLVCYVGAATVYDALDWLPQSNLILANPEVALAIGAFLIVTSFICQPSRLQ